MNAFHPLAVKVNRSKKNANREWLKTLRCGRIGKNAAIGKSANGGNVSKRKGFVQMCHATPCERVA